MKEMTRWTIDCEKGQLQQPHCLILDGGLNVLPRLAQKPNPFK